tara:strand:- start:4028 stop:4288 length:261 start_codon:yes stop_codon:yes gene_type:complete
MNQEPYCALEPTCQNMFSYFLQIERPKYSMYKILQNNLYFDIFIMNDFLYDTRDKYNLPDTIKCEIKIDKHTYKIVTIDKYKLIQK